MKRAGLLVGLALASLCCFAQNGNNYPASATAAPTIVPASDAGMDLGSLTARWRNAFLSGTLTWTNGSGTADTGISRLSAGIVAFGTGAAANTGGFLEGGIYYGMSGANVAVKLDGNNDLINTNSLGVLGFTSSSTNGNQALDTSISRDSAGVVDIGTGAQGSKAGTLNAAAININGIPVAGGFTCINVTPVTANANTAADQNLMACTITAGTLNSVGKTLLIQLAGVYSTPAGSTTTVNLKAKLCTVSGCGSGTVITLASITSAALGTIQVTNDPFNMTLNASTQTAGATASFEAHGNLVIDISLLTTAAEGIYADGNTATVGTIDSTAQLFLQITAAFVNASASNSITQRQLIMDTVD